MRILVATDAWHPQINGVVNTYEQLARHAPLLGDEIVVLTPADFSSIPCPTYPEIPLAFAWSKATARRIEALKPDAVHVATEGPVGWAVRRWCLKRGVPFTTSFHTRFPEYVRQRFLIPERWTWAVLRAFHNAGDGMMVAAPSLARSLAAQGFRKIMPWSRGVDTTLFHPRPVRSFGDDPVFLYVGRVAVEKSVEDFLSLKLPGRKVVVGDGPARAGLEQRFPEAHFTGMLTGTALAEAYASADVFVFPSRTDTFGNVLLEAMASGVPVAALPVTGPSDIVRPGETGILDENLARAAVQAMSLERTVIARQARLYDWDACTRAFAQNVRTALDRRGFARVRSRATPAIA
ncbi:MAG: glycosyltransferase family 4 protein [Hyphomicrobiaceae bacterium]